MALRLTDALGANTSLTRLSLASVGLLTAPATALGDALRRNGRAGGRLAHLDLRGNPLGSVATCQLLATLQVRSSKCPLPITYHLHYSIATHQLVATLQMSPTLQSLMLHDTGGAGLSRTRAGGALGHSRGSGPGGSAQAMGAGAEGGTPEFDPSRMAGEYALDLEKPWDAWVA